MRIALGVVLVAGIALGQIDPSNADLWAILRDAGIAAILLVGFLREWLVPGPTHRRVLEDRDKLLALALRSSSAAETATDVLKQRDDSDQVALRAAKRALEDYRADERG